jgi:hypothetical protein
VLGTLFRFWSYRKWVFAGSLDEDLQEPAELSSAGLQSSGVDSSELDPSSKG